MRIPKRKRKYSNTTEQNLLEANLSLTAACSMCVFARCGIFFFSIHSIIAWHRMVDARNSPGCNGIASRQTGRLRLLLLLGSRSSGCSGCSICTHTRHRGICGRIICLLLSLYLCLHLSLGRLCSLCSLSLGQSGFYQWRRGLWKLCYVLLVALNHQVCMQIAGVVGRFVSRHLNWNSSDGWMDGWEGGATSH